MKTAQKILEKVRDELLKQLHPMIHTNGYPSEAVPKGTILEIPQLLKDEISSLLEAGENDKQLHLTDEEIEEWAEKWKLKTHKEWEDVIMPYFKAGLKEGAKAVRDNKIPKNE